MITTTTNDILDDFKLTASIHTITIKTSDGSIVKTITVYQEGYYR